MKSLKIIAFLLIMFTAFSAFAQTNTVEATLVIDKNDTIRGEVKVWVNLFNKKLINELSFNRRTWLANGDDFLKIKTKRIYYLEFVDYFDKQRIFLTDQIIPNFPDKGLLYEKIIEGRLSWYKQYKQNPYDGSTFTLDHFCFENNAPVTLGALSLRKKKRLRDLTQEFPQLVELIDNYKTDDDLLLIIEQFNAMSTKELNN